MNIKIRTFFFILWGLTSFVSFSQKTMPVYNDYLSNNLYLVHPAIAGVNGYGNFRLTTRRQWLGINDAPNFSTASVDFRLEGASGVGAIFFTNANGNQSSTGIKLTYAYHLNLLNRNTNLNLISFAISPVFVLAGLDETGFLDSGLGVDNAITGVNNNVFYGNTDIGIGYHQKNLHLFYTVNNLLPVERRLLTNLSTSNIREHVASIGYTFKSPKMYYEPSFMFFTNEYSSRTFIDLNLKIYKYYHQNSYSQQRLWGAVSYRAGVANKLGNNLEQVSAIIGTNVKDFIFSYTFTTPLFSKNTFKGLFHQISIGYTFLKSKTFYECKCPGLQQF